MKQVQRNFVVDLAAFVAFVLLTTTGVLLRYILPPGSGRFTTLWGLDRHTWGQIHFWIALILLGILAIHLVLHWKWIVCMVKGRPTEGSGWRMALAVVGLIGLLGLAVAPLLSPVERKELPAGQRGVAATEQRETVVPLVTGAMSLEDVARRLEVPVPTLLRTLGLPEDIAPETRLSQLRRQYGLTLHEVRRRLQTLTTTRADSLKP